MEKSKNEPVLFIIVRIFLLLNMISSGFIVLLLIAMTFFDGFSSSFNKTEFVLDVRKNKMDTTEVVIDSSLGYGFKQSRTGDFAVMMPWYTPLFVPLGVFNLPGFEMSLPYWILYGVVCFLFYRIIASTSVSGPFMQKNIKRIFWIGYVLILYDVFSIVRSIILSVFVENLTQDAYRYDGMGPMIYYKVGILVIVTAMIYKKGVIMQQEQELTV